MSDTTSRPYKLFVLTREGGECVPIIGRVLNGYMDTPAMFLEERESLFLLHAGVISYMGSRALGEHPSAYLHVTKEEYATYGVFSY